MYWDRTALAALPRLLSAGELCRALHVNKQTALGLIHSGLLPMVVEQRHNCCFSVSKSDLKALLRRLEHCPELRSVFTETVATGFQSPTSAGYGCSRRWCRLPFCAAIMKLPWWISPCC